MNQNVFIEFCEILCLFFPDFVVKLPPLKLSPSGTSRACSSSMTSNVHFLSMQISLKSYTWTFNFVAATSVKVDKLQQQQFCCCWHASLNIQFSLPKSPKKILPPREQKPDHLQIFRNPICFKMKFTNVMENPFWIVFMKTSGDSGTRDFDFWNG